MLVTGLGDGVKANFAMALAKKTNARNKVFVTYSEQRARELKEDLQLYDKKAIIYPAKDLMFFAADVHGSAIVSARLEVMKRLLDNEASTIILTFDAGLLKVLPVSDVLDNILLLKVGDTVDLEGIREALTVLGYENVAQVAGKGQFSVRGGLIDIFSLTEDAPVRIELWGDEIDNIRYFDPESQRSIDDGEVTEEISIYPASEMILDKKRSEKGIRRITKEMEDRVKYLRGQMKTEQAARLRDTVNEFKDNLDIYKGSFGTDSYINYFYDNTESFFDYFGGDTIFFLDEPARITEMAEAVTTEFRESMSARLEGGYILSGQADLLWDYKRIFAFLSRRKTVLLSLIETKTGAISAARRLDVTARNVNPYNNDFNLLVKDIKAYKKSKSRVVLVSPNDIRAERITKELVENDVNAVFTKDLSRVPMPGETVCITGNLKRGFEYPLLGFVVIS